MNEAREKLGTMAEEINVRLGKAEGYDGRAETAKAKADDHRLAAALQLADARTLADENRIGWKRWVDKNIDRSYRDVKKLVAIGSAQDPVLALEGARKSDRDARARSREQVGGVIGDRAPGRPAGQQPASEEKIPMLPRNRSGDIDFVKGCLDGVTPDDLQAILSYAILHLLDRAAQRKLAKGLAEMVRKMDRPELERLAREAAGTFPLRAVESESDHDLTIPESLRRSQPEEKTDG